MKTPEDEAFEDIERKQGGFQAKRQMAADKLQEPWNEDEWRRNNWRCGHGWLRGEQCEICNAVQEPPSEWAGIKAILDEYGLQAIDFVADFKAALAQPAQELVAWPKATPEEQIIGWTLDYKFLESLSDTADGRPSAETVESVLLLAVRQVQSVAPPQRTWVGLNEKERNDIEDDFYANISIHVFDAIEAKLKEKNNGVTQHD